MAEQFIAHAARPFDHALLTAAQATAMLDWPGAQAKFSPGCRKVHAKL